MHLQSFAVNLEGKKEKKKKKSCNFTNSAANKKMSSYTLRDNRRSQATSIRERLSPVRRIFHQCMMRKRNIIIFSEFLLCFHSNFNPIQRCPSKSLLSHLKYAYKIARSPKDLEKKGPQPQASCFFFFFFNLQLLVLNSLKS